MEFPKSKKTGAVIKKYIEIEIPEELSHGVLSSGKQSR